MVYNGSMNETKIRLLWADLLKIIAIFGVIILHVSASYLVPFTGSREWWTGNIYDSLSRWCVPLFVMVSGALLLSGAGKRPLLEFLRVRVRRILVPFLAWSAIYFLYRIYWKGDDLPLYRFFTMILTEPIYYHLWFIYMLIVLYLFAPAAGAFLNRVQERHVWSLIGLWFFWASLLPILDLPLEFSTYFSPDMNDYSPVRLSGYFLLGYVLKEWKTRSAPGLSGLVLVFLMGAAGTIFGTFFMSRSAGEFHPFFYKYYSITVVVMSVSLFLLIKSIFYTRKETRGDGVEIIRFNSPKILQEIGISVFGVYLIHALVLEILRDGYFGFIIDHTNFLGAALPLWIGIPVFASTIFILSLLPILLIRRIPAAREIFA